MGVGRGREGIPQEGNSGSFVEAKVWHVTEKG